MKSLQNENKNQNNSKMEWQKILFFCKNNGVFFENASLYNGLKSNYDFGPLGTHIKNTIKTLWWKEFVTSNNLVVGMDSNILTLPKVLEASGHLSKFIDYIIKCPKCKNNFKLENLMPQVNENDTLEKIKKEVQKETLFCLECKKKLNYNEVFFYNLLFESYQGTLQDRKQKIYLRPETAQGIFLNYKKIYQAFKLNLPFGIAQIGKAFRNEITTQYGIFRTCEFEQLELEFFYQNEKEQKIWFKYWQDKMFDFFVKTLKLNPQNLRIKEHEKNKLAHYSKKTIDFEYNFPFGWKEIAGLADRSDFDLKNHQKESGENLTILNEKEKPIIPFVIEPSLGVERLLLALIVENLSENEKKKLTLRMPQAFSYYEIAILPLTEKLTEEAKKIIPLLKDYRIRFDNKKSIGKRYLFHDQIGTYYCITYDFDSLKDQAVTIRNRDTKKQTRIKIKDLINYFQN